MVPAKVWRTYNNNYDATVGQGVAGFQDDVPEISCSVVCICGLFTARVSWPVYFLGFR